MQLNVAIGRHARSLLRATLARAAAAYLLLILAFLWPSVLQGAVPGVPEI
jgi:predicted anti-sigma-YlaC factor YlaD